MHRHRLERLAKLTQGAALVGLGLGLGASLACNNDTKTINAPPEPVHTNAPPEPIHINATAEPTPSAAPSAAPTQTTHTSDATPPAATTSTAGTAPRSRTVPSFKPPHTINAPPQR